MRVSISNKPFSEENSIMKRKSLNLINESANKSQALIDRTSGLRISSPSSMGSLNNSVQKMSNEPKFIESVDLVKDITGVTFKPFFPTHKPGLRVTLEYPNPNFKERFYLMRAYTQGSKGLEPDLEEYNSISDIINTVEIIGKLAINKEDKEKILCSELGILRKLRRGENRRDGESFIDSIKEFNTLVREMRERNGFKKRDFPKYEILEHILFQTYARVASPDAHNLTNYEAFSNQVYGEINSNLVNEFVQLSGINKDSLFIDMGSGIGNVVLQVACQTGCRAHGIEIMEIPSALAKYQQIELRARMQMYLLPIPRIKFYRGDFLTHPDILRQLSEVDVLLVNNYVFDSELNVKIMELFLKLKEGCKIISLKNFAPLELKINNRNAGEPETILRVKKYDYGSDSVSWTANAGSFFIHTVDRKPLNRFLQSLGE